MVLRLIIRSLSQEITNIEHSVLLSGIYKKRYLANNERLIQMLSNSYPIRKAARFTARLIIRAKYFKEEALENMKKNNMYKHDEQGTKGTLLQIIEAMKKNMQTFLKDSEGGNKKP